MTSTRILIGRILQPLSIATGSKFRQNFLKIARANTLALALPIAFIPVLTRLFTPTDYASLSIFSSILALLAAVCTWRFDWILPNAKTRRMAANLVVLGCIALASTLIVFVSLLVFLPDTSIVSSRIAGTPNVDVILLMLPIALIGLGVRQILSGWLVRDGEFSPVSQSTVIQSSVNVISSLCSGLAKLGAAGLIVASTLSAWAGAGRLFAHVRRDLVKPVRAISVQSLRRAVRLHGRNATMSSLVSVVNALSLNAPIFMLAAVYTPHEVGWYATMYRLIGAPVGVLTSALGQSFWSRAAEQARAKQIDELRTFYLRTTRHLALACVPVVVLCVAGPFFVGPLLGDDEWGGAGYALAAMSPLFIGSILFSPTNHLVVLNKQHLQLAVDLARLGFMAIALWASQTFHLGFVLSVLIISASSLAGQATIFAIQLGAHREYKK